MKSNMQKMHNANSARAISFRQWATRILNIFITEGFAINRKLIKTNFQLFTKTVTDLRKLLPSTTATETIGIMEIIEIFADTWISLNAYDKLACPL